MTQTVGLLTACVVVSASSFVLLLLLCVAALDSDSDSGRSPRAARARKMRACDSAFFMQLLVSLLVDAANPLVVESHGSTLRMLVLQALLSERFLFIPEVFGYHVFLFLPPTPGGQGAPQVQEHVLQQQAKPKGGGNLRLCGADPLEFEMTLHWRVVVLSEVCEVVHTIVTKSLRATCAQHGGAWS